MFGVGLRERHGVSRKVSETAAVYEKVKVHLDEHQTNQELCGRNLKLLAPMKVAKIALLGPDLQQPSAF